MSFENEKNGGWFGRVEDKRSETKESEARPLTDLTDWGRKVGPFAALSLDQVCHVRFDKQ